MYCGWEDIEQNVLYLVFFVVVVVVVVFFFHSIIGYSSCNIQYKFIYNAQKKKEKKRRKNPKGVDATGLTSHGEAPPLA